MVENRPGLTILAHAVLIVGIAVVAFPLYVTFVASTLTLDEIVSVPMPLVPGSHLWDNYAQALTAGVSNAAGAPVGRMMLNSLVMALAIALGKIQAVSRSFEAEVDALVDHFYDDIGTIKLLPLRSLFDLFLIKVLWVGRGSRGDISQA